MYSKQIPALVHVMLCTPFWQVNALNKMQLWWLKMSCYDTYIHLSGMAQGSALSPQQTSPEPSRQPGPFSLWPCVRLIHTGRPYTWHHSSVVFSFLSSFVLSLYAQYHSTVCRHMAVFVLSMERNDEHCQVEEIVIWSTHTHFFNMFLPFWSLFLLNI